MAAPGLALADVDAACADVARPADYDEIVQQDFLANYIALASTLSAVHGPMPHEPGHGALGIRLDGILPLRCARRFVLDHTKTEDTNKTPVMPRLSATVALPRIGDRVVPWIGLAYVPPVPLFGTRTVVISGEAGAGVPIGEHFEVGARFHATVMRTIADVATAFSPSDPVYDDLFLASTFGADAMAAWRAGNWAPFVAVGFVDVSTFFWIGDDGVVTNNLHPYAGLAWSVGLEGLAWERLRLGAEYYGAPGGSRDLDPATTVPGRLGRYGSIHTVRLRIAVEL